jgi:SAM-dependent methyltransferase
MLAIARERFPGADLRQLDAADLSSFADASFDFVLFSFNGLDYVPHGIRLQVLGEVHRVLRTNGVFVFSSHNRNTSVEPPSLSAALKGTRTAGGRLVKLLEFAFEMWNARRLRPYVHTTADYAVYNDCAHNFRLLHYYITPDQQLRQLQSAGFSTLFCVGQGGDRLGLDVSSCTDSWLYYCACKADQTPGPSSESWGRALTGPWDR